MGGRREGNLAETKDCLGCKAWGSGCKAQEDIVQTASSCTSEHPERRLKFEHRRNVYFSLKFLNLFIITTLPLGCVCVVFMQVCMCVQVLVHVFVHASACVRVWDTEVSSNVIPQESSTLVFKTRVLTRTRSLLSKLGWLASEPQGSTCLSPQHWDHTCMSPRFDERPCLKQ